MGDSYSRNTTVGGIQNLGKFNDVINSLNAVGRKEFANILIDLKKVVMASQYLSDEEKQELLEVIEEIGEEAVKHKTNKTKNKMLYDGRLATLFNENKARVNRMESDG